MNVRLDSLQLVLFSSGIVIEDKLKTANTLNEALSGIFDGDPLIFPLPNDVPPEIPRILLKSKDEKHKLQIAPQRIDFIFQYKKEEEATPFPIPSLFEKFVKIFQYFKETVHTQFMRTAMVANWTIELEKFPGAECLLSKYIQKETPLKSPYALELHCLTKETIADLKVNKWVRIKSAPKKIGPEQDKFIGFVIDINTFPEEIYKFDEELLQRFLNESSKVAQNTIDVHLKRMEE